MSIQDLIATAKNQATAAQANPTVIEDAQTTPVAQGATAQPAADATMAVSPEALAAAMALLQQQQQSAAPQQVAAQTVQQAAAPVTTAVSQAVGQVVPQAQAQTLPQTVDADMARYMPMNAPSLNNAATGMAAVDAWLKPKYGSMMLNDLPVKAFEAIIDPTENVGLTPATTIRYNVGETAHYIKTYDGQNSSEGMPWEVAVRQAMALSDKPLDRPYTAIDMVLTADEDVVNLNDGSVVAPKGTVIGHATAVTGTGNAIKLLNAIKASNLAHDVVENGKPLVKGQPVKIKVTNVSKNKGSSKQWGILDFELLGAAE